MTAEARLHAKAAEAAARRGWAEEVVRAGLRAAELRELSGDAAGARRELEAACGLLEGMGRADLNTPIADRLIELGLRAGEEDALIEGVLRLLENYEARAQETVRRRLDSGGTLLPALRKPACRGKAQAALERLKRVMTN